MELIRFSISHEADIGHTRRSIQNKADLFGMSSDQVAHLGLSVNELATNLVKCRTKNGYLACAYSEILGERSVAIYSVDEGPGIPDTIAAMQDSFSTHGSLGIGLGTVARHSDEFAIYSRTPRRTDTFLKGWSPSGTAIVSRLWKKPATKPWHIFSHTEGCLGEQHNGDGVLIWESRGTLRVAVSDGLGHGFHANKATELALDVCREHPDVDLKSLMVRIHAALRKTRGCALLLVEIQPASKILSSLCVGNITLRIDSLERSLYLPHRGILGASTLPNLVVRETSWGEGATAYLFSDGLSGRWDFQGERSLFSQDVGLIGQLLLRDQSRRKDDTSLVIIRGRSDES